MKIRKFNVEGGIKIKGLEFIEISLKRINN